MDFSGACVDARLKEGGGQARVLFVVGYPTGAPRPLRGVNIVISEDHEAVWVVGTRGKREWEEIRRVRGGGAVFVE